MELLAIIAIVAFIRYLSRRRYRHYRVHPAPGRTTQALRNQVYRIHGRRCVYCGSCQRVQVDHVRPRSAGGGTILINLLPLCYVCNRTKSNYWPGVRYRPFAGYNDPVLARNILQRELDLVQQQLGVAA